MYLSLALDNFTGNILTINLWLFSCAMCLPDFFFLVSEYGKYPRNKH